MSNNIYYNKYFIENSGLRSTRNSTFSLFNILV
jgi:hypothetical protein